MTRRNKRVSVAIQPPGRLPVGPGLGPVLDPTTLDFGHHAGRTIEELMRIVPDYLLWLATDPVGARYRAEIARILDRVADPER